MTKRIYSFLVAIILLSVTFYYFAQVKSTDGSVVATIIVPSDRFPETAAHIKAAEEHGKSNICTIDRKGADENRKESLKGVPTKKGYDRDEYPMAMCAEGGKGADIEYVTPADNRGAGSYIANQLEKFEDGKKVKIVVK
ncbi:NucA/NucB deoxyribonuclease domain-containing protein [Paenibacillus alginolyticus]|uniref:NucA/NucB deoxyribonuclease domain-containing protein n=1 Tax=Paenibacillus alginolyticus TaxID=59839 RepID=A0ABT4GK36_9BACL|nr:NucA/NucB deoxyribonuclease domain-containing protein [Paenibacillus alginolyticus]MCY9668235.1 NucA/NucB deoxyribonuclease domain-containing protein [Paenibacillus alginolyticus]MCY9696562.1 NucA/NucB deoxyribonuclease domain-containing protein [Paenibacillus alginolyticus]MEC0148651.1 NucA/NucB deoxyribonuclease domain-containing protein [Paenibacillus alginolyticus]